MLSEYIQSNSKISRIIINLIEVLRINIVIVGSQGKLVLAPKVNGFGFKGSCQWGGLKFLGTPELISKFKNEGNNCLSYIDPFSFQNFALPLKESKILIGYLILGPVILNKPLSQEEYQKIAQKHEIVFNDFQEYLNETRAISFNTLRLTMELLSDISQFSFSSTKPELIQEKPDLKSNHQLLNTLLDLSMALTQAECGSIMLFNKKEQVLTIEFSKGLQGGHFNSTIKLGEGIAGLAAQEKTPFIIDQKKTNNRLQHLLIKPELKCAVVLPIMDQDKEVLGVMNISTVKSNSTLAKHSQQMLESLTRIYRQAFNIQYLKRKSPMGEGAD